MQLSELWFLLIGVLFVGFMFLEGFDFGVGMGAKFLAKDDEDNRLLNKAIGPTWAGNEVWLITAIGAMFAAFPHWYATLFSGYYLLFLLLVIALMGRGVSLEVRGRGESKRWRNAWDWAMFAGSILPPFLLGIVFTSLIKGLPIDADMNMYAGFFDVVNVYTIVGGLLFVVLSYLHGLTFLTLKTTGDLHRRAQGQAQKMYALTGLLLIAFIALTVVHTDAFTEKGVFLIPMYVLVVILYGVLLPLIRKGKEGLSFTMTGFVLIIVTASFFIALFPNVMVSSLGAAQNISVYTAASGDYSLKLMTIVAATMLPIILGYTLWSYYVFRKRVSTKESAGY